ncbi:hypothetical protein HWV62_28388 [Athelia sp. TMB]|nr:hypothetical protein HWV62_28388 [Athelia sp. TMB]
MAGTSFTPDHGNIVHILFGNETSCELAVEFDNPARLRPRQLNLTRHPETTNLTDHIIRVEGVDLIIRPHACVYKGMLDFQSSTRMVAVKHITCRGDHRLAVRVRREIFIWMGLSHANIVELLGTTNDPNYPSLGMVSDWMDNGNLGAFIVEGLALSHRLEITCDVAAGLAYCTIIYLLDRLSTDLQTTVHSKDVIHGDLTSGNVLIDNTGRALLVDFGLSSITAAFEGTSFMASVIGGALRFRALELMPPVDKDHNDFEPELTTASDIYSLGSVILQTLSGQQPYYNIQDDFMVALVLAQRRTPERPHSQKLIGRDEYWRFIGQCWSKDTIKRPNAEAAHKELLRLREEVLR